jgi:hypothetical protein
MGEPLGEPRHQYRPQRPTRLNVPENAYCLSCLPAGLNFSEAMTAKQQMPALSREEVSYSDPDLSSVVSFDNMARPNIFKKYNYNFVFDSFFKF